MTHRIVEHANSNTNVRYWMETINLRMLRQLYFVIREVLLLI